MMAGKNLALIGMEGYIALRHIEAIADTLFTIKIIID